MKPNFVALGCMPVDELFQNERHCASLGLKRLEPRAGAEPLAVVGGGPSVAEHVEELQNWQGGIWAINGAMKWCRDRDIPATLFSIDPLPTLVDSVVGADKAYLASCCHPSVFAALRAADVTTFDIMAHIEDDGKRLNNGPTSAATVPFVALRAGYRHVTFFGCEGNYDDIAHANTYATPVRENWLKVAVPSGEGHVEFLTDAEFCMQSDFLAAYIRALPWLYAEQSGGLLRALVTNPEWQAVAMSPEILRIMGEAA